MDEDGDMQIMGDMSPSATDSGTSSPSLSLSSTNSKLIEQTSTIGPADINMTASTGPSTKAAPAISTPAKIIASVCSVLGFVFIVALILFFLHRRRRSMPYLRTSRNLSKHGISLSHTDSHSISPTPLITPTTSNTPVPPEASKPSIPLTPPLRLRDRKILAVPNILRSNSTTPPPPQRTFPTAPYCAPTTNKLIPRHERTKIYNSKIPFLPSVGMGLIDFGHESDAGRDSTSSTTPPLSPNRPPRPHESMLEMPDLVSPLSPAPTQPGTSSSALSSSPSPKHRTTTTTVSSTSSMAYPPAVLSHPPSLIAPGMIGLAVTDPEALSLKGEINAPAPNPPPTRALPATPDAGNGSPRASSNSGNSCSQKGKGPIRVEDPRDSGTRINISGNTARSSTAIAHHQGSNVSDSIGVGIGKKSGAEVTVRTAPSVKEETGVIVIPAGPALPSPKATSRASSFVSSLVPAPLNPVVEAPSPTSSSSTGIVVTDSNDTVEMRDLGEKMAPSRQGLPDSSTPIPASMDSSNSAQVSSTNSPLRTTDKTIQKQPPHTSRFTMTPPTLFLQSSQRPRIQRVPSSPSPSSTSTPTYTSPVIHPATSPGKILPFRASLPLRPASIAITPHSYRSSTGSLPSVGTITNATTSPVHAGVSPLSSSFLRKPQSRSSTSSVAAVAKVSLSPDAQVFAELSDSYNRGGGNRSPSWSSASGTFSYGGGIAPLGSGVAEAGRRRSASVSLRGRRSRDSYGSGTLEERSNNRKSRSMRRVSADTAAIGQLGRRHSIVSSCSGWSGKRSSLSVGEGATRSRRFVDEELEELGGGYKSSNMSVASSETATATAVAAIKGIDIPAMSASSLEVDAEKIVEEASSAAFSSGMCSTSTAATIPAGWKKENIEWSDQRSENARDR